MKFAWPEGLNVVLYLSDIKGQATLAWPSAARREAMRPLTLEIDEAWLRGLWPDLVRLESSAVLAFMALPPLAVWLQESYVLYGVPASRVLRSLADAAPLAIPAAPHERLWREYFADYLDLQQPVLTHWLTAQLQQFADFIHNDGPKIITKAFQAHTNDTGAWGSYAVAWLTCDLPTVVRSGPLVLTSTYFLTRPYELAAQLPALLATDTNS